MMNSLNAIRVNKPLLQSFRQELIRENSRRFFFILLLVIATQLVFIPLEILRVLPWQNNIFISRLGVIAACLLFIGLIRLPDRSRSGMSSVNLRGYLISAIQVVCLLVGCYFVVNAFRNEIHSFSAYLLVAFVVSLTCVRYPFCSYMNSAVFIALTVTLHLFVEPVSFWISEFLISLVLVVLLFIGSTLDYNRRAHLFLKEREILDMNRKLMEMSQVDMLTGVHNRRKLSDAIEEHIQLFERYQRSFCLAILDIDLFKQINDTYGHNTGDSVLCCFTRQVKSMLRSTDVFGRWGGEEFLLILPSCCESEAFSLIERLRKEIYGMELLPDIRITFSAGIRAYQNHESFSELVSKADQALYAAKKTGRNKSVVYETCADRGL